MYLYPSISTQIFVCIPIFFYEDICEYTYMYSYMNKEYTYYYNFEYFYFLFINTLVKPYDKNDLQHNIETAHGIIAIIKNKGDISIIISLSSFVQIHNDILSSVIFIIFIYILLNLILGYFLIRG